MNKPIALFAAWVLFYSQALSAQQTPGVAPPPQPTNSPGLSMGGLRGWLQKYKYQEVAPINLQNSGR
ncbi:MAG: hypothetical protein IT165_19005, partial [Bryobacterales bacterium]|nr:hypothetical protein [Bryobacterales bacterium]